MTKKLIISRVGVIRQVSAKAELEPVNHPKADVGHYPRTFLQDTCVGANHLTYVKVNSWRVSAGVHDPYSLRDTTLKRLNNTDSEATQTDLDVSVGAYTISLTGTGKIIFNGGDQVEWGTGSLTQDEILSDETTTVEFKGARAPQSVTICLTTDTQQVSKIELIDTHSIQKIMNPEFNQVETHFYDVESWWVASLDPEIVPPDVLGYLEGFNEYTLYTVFE